MVDVKKIFFNISLLFLIIIISINAHSEKIEDIKLDYFVNDYANVLTIEEENTIADELIPLFDNNTAQISVVIINSTDGQDITSFAYQLAEGKLGDKEKNNGLLILIAVNDKKYRFEVGRGLEPYLNDAKIGRIAREQLISNFKKQDYYTGIYSSVLSIKSVLEKNIDSTYYPKEQGLTFNQKVLIFFIIFIIFLVIIELVSNQGQNTNSFNNTNNKNKRNRDDIFMAAGTLASILKGGKGGSGGFGGFGGGSFGGGGAGGGW